MFKTLEQLLKEKGQTDDQIKNILSTLGPARDVFESELREADRKNTEAQAALASATEKETRIDKFWKEEATPQINTWSSEVASAKAREAFLRTQVDEAKKQGFIAAELPGDGGAAAAAAGGAAAAAAAAAGGNGHRANPNSNEVPGSPSMSEILNAITTVSRLEGEHQKLFGEPLIDLPEIMEEARKTGRKAIDVWATKYKVQERRDTIAREAKEKETAELTKTIETKVRKEYAEKYGDPNRAPMVPSRFPNYAKDEKTGAPNKMAWTDPDRKQKLRNSILEGMRTRGEAVN